MEYESNNNISHNRDPRNMNVTEIPIIVGALITIPNNMEKEFVEIEI